MHNSFIYLMRVFCVNVNVSHISKINNKIKRKEKSPTLLFSLSFSFFLFLLKFCLRLILLFKIPPPSLNWIFGINRPILTALPIIFHQISKTVFCCCCNNEFWDFSQKFNHFKLYPIFPCQESNFNRLLFFLFSYNFKHVMCPLRFVWFNWKIPLVVDALKIRITFFPTLTLTLFIDKMIKISKISQ